MNNYKNRANVSKLRKSAFYALFQVNENILQNIFQRLLFFGIDRSEILKLMILPGT